MSVVMEMVGVPNQGHVTGRFLLGICHMVKGIHTLWDHRWEYLYSDEEKPLSEVGHVSYLTYNKEKAVYISGSGLFIWLNKTSSNGTLLGRTSSEVFVMLVVVFLFIFVLHFVVVLHSFPGYFAMPLALHLGFLGRWMLPPALSPTLATFDYFCFFIYHERYGFGPAFFTHRRFLPLAPSPKCLAQPAFIKASLGASSSSLKFSGLYPDPQNTGPTHLFVWFTATHNRHIQKNSFLHCTKYYHELLVVKV